jgi:hypothetical protein
MWRSLLLAALCAAAAATPAQTPEAATRDAMSRLCTELSLPCNSCGQHRQPGTPAPTPRPTNDLMRRPVDGWGHAMQISVGGEGIALRSPGADGELGTADDLTRACGNE